MVSITGCPALIEDYAVFTVRAAKCKGKNFSTPCLNHQRVHMLYAIITRPNTTSHNDSIRSPKHVLLDKYLCDTLSSLSLKGSTGAA